MSTHATAAFFEEELINTGTVNQGSARIFATSKNVLCSAMLDVWECLEDNGNPGVDQRYVLTDTSGNYLTEKSKENTKKKYTPGP